MLKLDSKEGVELAIRRISDARKPKKPENICNLGRCFNGNPNAHEGYALDFVNRMDFHRAKEYEQQCRRCCDCLGEEMREIQEKIHHARNFEVSVVKESDLLEGLKLTLRNLTSLKRRANENHAVVLGRKGRIQREIRDKLARGI
ncbi:MAG: succinylglutamate desuccinylase/aspartoacylase family protein [Candidatus Moranbacteria bacterium]|nr:succinylglutamate desuccinylase/aspartoacylase family protein [Candidatus Moranbacteria bacterium]